MSLWTEQDFARQAKAVEKAKTELLCYLITVADATEGAGIWRALFAECINSMGTATAPEALIESLDAEQIRQQLTEGNHKQRALTVLLRAALRRNRQQGQTHKPEQATAR